MLIEDLKKARMNAMRDKEEVKKNLLATLIGAAEQDAKLGSDGKKEKPTDDKIMACIRSFVKNANIAINDVKEKSTVIPEGVIEKLEAEIAILTSFLPKQMSEAAILTAIGYAKNMGAKNIGDFMKYFTTNHAGLYDGKLVSDLVRANL